MGKPFALLVEDDRDVATLFRHVLDMAGYESESILDGKEAMDRLATIRPDIVLLDLQLPSMSGVEILKRMRADERMKTIPVVVVTAYAYYANSLPVKLILWGVAFALKWEQANTRVRLFRARVFAGPILRRVVITTVMAATWPELF